CPGAVVVTGARSAAFASVELHETRVVDGVSRMRAVERMPVMAGEETLLRPGGLHLMLMRPLAPLAEGDVARVVFLLADGRRIAAGSEVRAPGARCPHRPRPAAPADAPAAAGCSNETRSRRRRAGRARVRRCGFARVYGV